MKRFLLALAVLCGSATIAYAADTAIVVSTCGTPPSTYTAGLAFAITQDTTGTLCSTGSGGGGGSLSAKATAADPSYVEGSTDPLSMTLSGYQRSASFKANAADPTFVEGSATYGSVDLAGYQRIRMLTSQLASASNPAPITPQPLTVSQNPLTSVGLNITTATTTHVVAGTAAQTVRVYKLLINCATAGQTIDFQTSTAHTSLNGAPMTCPAAGGLVLDLDSVSWFTTASGDGLDLVTSGTQTVTGAIYYVKS